MRGTINMLHLFTTWVRIVVLSILITSGLLVPGLTAAQVIVTDGDLEATFSSTPLFNATTNPAFAPSSTQGGTITVTNNGLEVEPVWLSAVATSSTGLADAVELKVDTTGQILYSSSFAEFFATSSVYLADLLPGESSTYTLTANFASSSGNVYQGTTMGFDLRIGFAGGAGVTGVSGAGSGVSGTVTRPTPGSSNNPDGIVAGVATDGMSDLSDSQWPVWDYVTAAISNALGPQRVMSESSDLYTATTTDIRPESIVATTSRVDENQLGDNYTEKEQQALCLQLWFLLLVILGLVARFFAMLVPANSPQPEGAVSWLSYLVCTAAYVLGLLLLSLSFGIGSFWGWVLFSVWTAHQVYDMSLCWLQNQYLSRLRVILLLIGLFILFTLPPYVAWLCQWWLE